MDQRWHCPTPYWLCRTGALRISIHVLAVLTSIIEMWPTDISYCPEYDHNIAASECYVDIDTDKIIRNEKNVIFNGSVVMYMPKLIGIKMHASKRKCTPCIWRAFSA